MSPQALFGVDESGFRAGQPGCPGFGAGGIVSILARCYDGRVKTNITAAAQQMSRTTSFRLFLQQELARRCSRNSQYSLRSFALQLDKDHSTLSQLLRQLQRRFGLRASHEFEVRELSGKSLFRSDRLGSQSLPMPNEAILGIRLHNMQKLFLNF